MNEKNQNMGEEQINFTISGTEIFVWSADDWLTLRQKYRILGDCIGCIAKKPRQDNLTGLPMLLLPEEAKLLLDKGIGCLVQRPILKETPTESLRKKFENYRNKLFLEQQETVIERRKVQIASVMDKIVEGKKRKILGLHTRKKKMRKPLDNESQKALDEIEIDKEALMQEEISKLPGLEKSDALVQTHTAYPWNSCIVKVEDWNYPSNEEDTLKYKVFKDIWERGYFITSGQKFGCDYLAYPGDPIMFHSQLLIHCKRRNEEISVSELIAESRIGSHVRKTLIFATLSKDDETVEYFSSRWSDSSMGEL